MPVRSSNSSVLKWPDRDQVIRAARRYAEQVLAADERAMRVGIFGSYAKGTMGPGSDADILVELADCEEPFERRALRLPPPRLPVPVDLLVLTSREIADRTAQGGRWQREVLATILWLAARQDADGDAPA